MVLPRQFQGERVDNVNRLVFEDGKKGPKNLRKWKLEDRLPKEAMRSIAMILGERVKPRNCPEEYYVWGGEALMSFALSCQDFYEIAMEFLWWRSSFDGLQQFLPGNWQSNATGVRRILPLLFIAILTVFCSAVHRYRAW
jgi:hypothetical protein